MVSQFETDIDTGVSIPVTSAQKIVLYGVWNRAHRCKQKGGSDKDVKEILASAYEKAAVVLPVDPLCQGRVRMLRTRPVNLLIPHQQSLSQIIVYGSRKGAN